MVREGMHTKTMVTSEKVIQSAALGRFSVKLEDYGKLN